MQINAVNIPSELRSIDQWVTWKTIIRDGNPTKVPFQPTGSPAKSNDPETWSSFRNCVDVLSDGSWAGIGFVFSAEDPYCGIDLDGCRNPQTGVIESWAKDIITDIKSYAEVSPSETGAKIWVRGSWPYSGHKIEVNVPHSSSKTPAIEVYDSTRYFAVTGRRLQDCREIKDAQEKLDTIRKQFWKETISAPSPSVEWRSEPSVMDRAEKYLARMPISISGQNGSKSAFHAACVLVQGFDLTKDQALTLLRVWNQGCLPPWSERELQHKVDDADRLIGERGYLRNASPQRYDLIQLPDFSKPRSKDAAPIDRQPDIKATTLKDAAERYLRKVESGEIKLLDLGLPELDDAIGGGVEAGEMIIFAARPSHGKSMAALQVIHHFTAWNIPCLFISEEMSDLTLGKRAIAYSTSIHKHDWAEHAEHVRSQLAKHFESRAPCYIVENCRTVDRAIDQIRLHVERDKVGLVAIDYVQQFGGGKLRHEEITRASRALKNVADECKIPIIVLSQLSRAIESRSKFVPQMSDLKDSGQLEQDADVIVVQVWPFKIDPVEQDKDEYKLFVMKNRNREINKGVVTCKFDGARQMLKPMHQPMDDADTFNANAINWDIP